MYFHQRRYRPLQVRRLPVLEAEARRRPHGKDRVAAHTPKAPSRRLRSAAVPGVAVADRHPPPARYQRIDRLRAQPDCRQYGRLSSVRVETVDSAEYREAFGEQWQHRLVSSERAQVGRPAPAAMHFAFLSRPQLQQH